MRSKQNKNKNIMGPPGKFPPFSKTCEAYLKMVEMLESGELDSSESPKLAFQKHPLFQLHDPNAFRAGLNKYKVSKGYYTRDTAETYGPPPPQGMHSCFKYVVLMDHSSFLIFFHAVYELLQRTQRLLLLLCLLLMWLILLPCLKS
jgi:hypothetical protein